MSAIYSFDENSNDANKNQCDFYSIHFTSRAHGGTIQQLYLSNLIHANCWLNSYFIYFWLYPS